MESVIEFARRGASNNTVINVFLLSAFGGLSVRSWNQQSLIETLESERDSLMKSNKSMRQSIWDWKQNLLLYKDHTVPLSNLKSIFGESAGTPEKNDTKASTTKIII